jgi:hypothetical protein
VATKRATDRQHVTGFLDFPENDTTTELGQGNTTANSSPHSPGIPGISVPTAKRHWTYARAWFYTEVKTAQ